MRGQPTLFTVVVSPKDPPRGTPRPWGCCLPERTLRGVRVWWLPWVPTEAMGWTVGTRGHLAGSCRRFADPRPPGSLTPAWHTRDGFFRNGGPGQSAAGHGRAGEHPVVDRRSSPGSWSRLRSLVRLNKTCSSWELLPAARTCAAASSQPSTSTARAGVAESLGSIGLPIRAACPLTSSAPPSSSRSSRAARSAGMKPSTG